MRQVAAALAVLLLLVLAWQLVRPDDIHIVVNGHALAGPEKLAAEGWAVVVALVVLFCAAILMVFVAAGVGLLLLGLAVLGGAAAAWVAFPFLLPLLIPLAVVWLFVALARSRRRPRY